MESREILYHSTQVELTQLIDELLDIETDEQAILLLKWIRYHFPVKTADWILKYFLEYHINFDECFGKKIYKFCRILTRYSLKLEEISAREGGCYIEGVFDVTRTEEEDRLDDIISLVEQWFVEFPEKKSQIILLRANIIRDFEYKQIIIA